MEPPLLEIVTEGFHLEIRGPTESKFGHTRKPRRPAHLEVHGQAILRCRTGTEPLEEWRAGYPGPYLFEQTAYRLSVRALKSTKPPERHNRDPRLFADVYDVSGTSACVGTINFGRRVGRSSLEFVAGPERLVVVLEVFPSKLDYATDFANLIDDLDSAARGLALDFLSSTYQLGTPSIELGNTNVEWAQMLRHVLLTVDKAIRFINQRPVRELNKHTTLKRAQALKGSRQVLLKTVARGRGVGRWQSVGSFTVREFIPAVAPQEVLDTPEHRWLLASLRSARDRTQALARQTRLEADQAARTSGESPRRIAAAVELESAAILLDDLLSLPMFVGVGAARDLSFSSVALQSRPGYQEAARGLVILRSAIGNTGGLVEFETKDVSELYEIWCFVRLAAILRSALGVSPQSGDLVEVDASGFRVRLRQGSRSRIRFPLSDREIELSYNESFPGITGEQRPDILLRFRCPALPEIVVIFDAKYRLDATPQYVATFGQPGPPVDAVNALHRYRDAIVVGANEALRGRPVVKGVALFPFCHEESVFKSHGLYRSLEVLGIGALPFLPGQQDLVSDWLKALVGLPITELASPGPPFLAQDVLQRQRVASSRKT